MRLCKKCKNPIPKFVVVGGQQRNLQNRSFCLSCSPFGQHNTRADLSSNRSNKFKCVCKICNVEFNAQRKNKSVCSACEFKIRKKTRTDKVYGIVGDSCWLCDYNRGVKGRNILNFHHVNPDEKCFNLTTREITLYSWSRIIKEMRKCVLLCCRCHQEYEHGLIDKSVILDLFKKWVNLGE